MIKNLLNVLKHCLLSFFIYLPCAAQKTRDVEVDMASYTAQIVKLSGPEKKYNPVIPINDIEVYDIRPDTLNSGFIEHSTNKKEKLIRFNRPVSVVVRDFLQSQINFSDSGANSNRYTLVCFIKKLFLSDNIYIDNNRQASSSDLNFEIKSGIMAFFEFYAKSGDSYFPLYRFDTTITGKKDIAEINKQYFEKVLTTCIQKLETINSEKIIKYSRSKSLKEINTYNRSRFQVPILNENLRKGLYLNFESFKNNAPLDTPFTVDKSNKGDYLYVKNQKGEDMLQTDIWGYCDGANMYIFSAENYFKLYRQGNTFIIYGAKGFTSTRRLRLNFGLLDVAMPNSTYAKSKTSNSYSLELRLLQLDMESGELY